MLVLNSVVPIVCIQIVFNAWEKQIYKLIIPTNKKYK